MKIYIDADHRGFRLKKKLFAWLRDQGYDAHDCGNGQYNPADDYPLIVDKVVASMEANGLENSRGIVICGSGIGVDIAANRHKGIRAGLGFDVGQVRHGRDHENINVLALAADEISYDQAIELVKAFLETKALSEPRMVRREKQLDA